MTAVEKAELARLRVATPTTIPAFAEARARRLAELEARFADAKERRDNSPLTPGWDAAQARQVRAERSMR